MKYSHDCGGIKTRILKLSIPYILSLFSYICNRMISTRVFPSRLEFSEIKSVLKRRDKRKISNYRPIFMLTSFSETFEKVILNDLPGR